MTHGRKWVAFYWLYHNASSLTERASPIGEENGEDYQDDDYDYGGEDDSGNSDGPPAPIVEDVQSAPPYFEQSDVVIDAKPGDDVIINCDARNYESMYFNIPYICLLTWWKQPVDS